MTTPTPIEEVKISDKILHINCDKDLSEEAIKYINKMVEIAYNMSEEELKALNKTVESDKCPHLKTHMRGNIITCSNCKKPFY